jgi:hypothetical protein
VLRAVNVLVNPGAVGPSMASAATPGFERPAWLDPAR